MTFTEEIKSPHLAAALAIVVAGCPGVIQGRSRARMRATASSVCSREPNAVSRK